VQVDRAVADMPKPRTWSFLTVHGTEIEMKKQAGTIDWRNIFDPYRVPQVRRYSLDRKSEITHIFECILRVNIIVNSYCGC
jgi:hypothetical protein